MKNDVATGDVRASTLETQRLAHGFEVGHRQLARATNVDGSQQGDVSRGHGISVVDRSRLKLEPFGNRDSPLVTLKDLSAHVIQESQFSFVKLEIGVHEVQGFGDLVVLVMANQAFQSSSVEFTAADSEFRSELVGSFEDFIWDVDRCFQNVRRLEPFASSNSGIMTSSLAQMLKGNNAFLGNEEISSRITRRKSILRVWSQDVQLGIFSISKKILLRFFASESSLLYEITSA